MGKPRRPRGERSTGERPASRRPRGPRSTWEPVPPLDPAELAPPAETAPEPAVTSGPAPVAPPIAVETEAEAEPAILALPVVAPSILPASVAEPGIPNLSVPEPCIPESEASSAPVARAAGSRVALAPERLDLAGIGATVAGYVRGEGEAALAHVRAISEARSPADLIRLQVGEIQRAADASLTCWSTVARKVGRIFAFR